jgi:hypothetical protein
LRTLNHAWKNFWQTFLFRILKTDFFFNNDQSAGSIVKNYREITLKNSGLLISSVLEINL